MKIIKTMLCTMLAAGLSSVASAQVQRVNLDIKPQPMRLALKDLGVQAGLQILFRSQDVAPDAPTAPRISGELSPTQALDQMLKDTPFKYKFVNRNTVLISRVAAVAAEERPERRAESASPLALAQSRSREEVVAGTSTDREPRATPTGTSESIEEILVTAQKRMERLQDVPVPVTAVAAESLVNSNQVRLQDYFARVPGLALVSGGIGGRGGLPQLTIRGLTTGGFANPTVGVVIDDIPIGSPTGSAFGQFTPDLDPSDLERVEVLRGPQGTLYGASSVGGLIKYVTADPSSDDLNGRLQAGVSDIRGGDQVGYSLRGAVNVPLADDLAVRVSGFTRNDPGYLRDALTGEKGINESTSKGGHLAALWRMSPAFSVKLSALLQEIDSDRPADITALGLGDLETNATPGLGQFKAALQAYQAILNARIGGVDVVSMTGYNIVDTKNRGDFGAFGLALLEHFKTRRFTQEVRATIPLGERFEWLVGGYYNDARNDPREQNLYPVDAVSGALGGPIYFDHNPSKFTEYAGFTDLTVELSDRFDVQVGARQSHIVQSAFDTQTQPDGSEAEISPFTEVKADATTFLVTPRLKLAPNAMVYARFASGYRPGGPNPNATLPGVPDGYGPDKSQNYEVGFKASTADRLLAIDASLYYIRWTDLQTTLIVPGNAVAGYIDNVGNARSQGVELSLEAHPWQGLALLISGAWNDAELSKDLPSNSAVAGFKGDQLPYSPRLSGYFSADQEFPLGERWIGTAGFSVSAIGERYDIFGASADRTVFPAYTKIDIRAGVRWDSWSISTFVNNVADKRGVLSISSATGYIAYITPRTAGISLTKAF